MLCSRCETNHGARVVEFIADGRAFLRNTRTTMCGSCHAIYSALYDTRVILSHRVVTAPCEDDPIEADLDDSDSEDPQ